MNRAGMSVCKRITCVRVCQSGGTSTSVVGCLRYEPNIGSGSGAKELSNKIQLTAGVASRLSFSSHLFLLLARCRCRSLFGPAMHSSAYAIAL